MPRIEFGSVKLHKSYSANYVEPVIGVVSKNIGISSSPIYVNSVRDYYNKIGTPSDDEGLLLDSGYHLKVLPMTRIENNSSGLRLFNNDYCFLQDIPDFKGSIVPSSKNILFSQLDETNTYSIKFKMPYTEIEKCDGIRSSLPDPPVDPELEGKLYLYVGIASETLKSNEFYKCVKVESKQDDEEVKYEWQLVTRNYIVLSTGYRSIAIVFDEDIYNNYYTTHIIARRDLYSKFFYTGTSNTIDMDRFKTYVIDTLGMSIELKGEYLVLYKKDVFTLSYYTTLSDFTVDISTYGNSLVHSCHKQPLLDIRCNLPTIDNNYKVTISKLASLDYKFQILHKEELIEEYIYSNSEASANQLNSLNGVATFKFYEAGELPIGTFTLYTEMLYIPKNNNLTTSSFKGFPEVSVIIDKKETPLVIDTDVLVLSDYKAWSDSIIRVSGGIRVSDREYSSASVFLAKLHRDNILGTIGQATEVIAGVIDSNIIYNDIYTIDTLNFFYYKKGIKVSAINILTQALIEYYIENNLKSRTTIELSGFVEIMSKLQWLSSFKGYSITKFNKSGSILTITIILTLQGYDGVEEVIPLDYTINS